MDSAFTRAAAALARDPNLSAAAVYGLPNGAAIRVRVVRRDQEREGVVNRDQLDLSSTTFELTKCSVPERPVADSEGEDALGCTISIGPTTWLIYDVSEVVLRDVWLVTGRIVS